MENSTLGQRNAAAMVESRARARSANEMVNPVLNVQGLKASPHDLSGDSVQASLLFSYDLHGLRKAKVHAADAEVEATESQMELDRLDFFRASLVSLHRIREITAQLAVQTELAKSIAEMIKIYLRRPHLTPEQETSRTLLEFSKDEIRSRISLQAQEKHALEHDVEIQIGQTWTSTPQNLPARPARWPALPAEASLPPDSLPARHLRALQTQNEKESEVLRLEKRPFLLVGPSAEWTQIEGERGVRAGATIQIPLDLVESHSASREVAASAKRKASAFGAANLRETAGEYDHGRETYHNSVTALATMPDGDTIRRRLARVEKLLRQGLVPASTYIESLRQVLALMQARDELEIKAIDAYCRLSTIKGSVEGCML